VLSNDEAKRRDKTTTTKSSSSAAGHNIDTRSGTNKMTNNKEGSATDPSVIDDKLNLQQEKEKQDNFQSPEDIIAAAAIPDVIARSSYFDLPAHKSSSASVGRANKIETLDTKAIATNTDDGDGNDDRGHYDDVIINDNKKQRQQQEHTAEEDGKDFTTSVKDAVKAVVAEASDAIKTVKEASTVSHAVKELHQRLVESIGVITMDGIKVDLAANDRAEESTNINNKYEDELEEGEHDLVMENRAGHGLENDNNSARNVAEHDIEGQAPSPRSSEHTKDSTPTTKEYDQATKEEEHHKYSSPHGDSEANNNQNVGIDQVLRSFPSSRCLGNLNFAEFKAKIVASRSSPSGSGGNTGSPTGKMEPIFKTLTDEIRALKLHQNVQDQFNQAQVACYQSIMLEMAAELGSLRMNQEARLRKLEAAMMEKDNFSMSDFLNPIVTIFNDVMDTCVSTTQAKYIKICAFCEKNSLQSVLRRLLDSEHGPLLLSLTSLAGFYAIICHVVMVFLYPFSRRQSKKERPSSQKQQLASTTTKNYYHGKAKIKQQKMSE